MPNQKQLALSFAFLVLVSYVATAQDDFPRPDLTWQTIETPHFLVHFHNGAARSAREFASVAESVYGPITRLYQHEPDSKVSIVIRDHDDYSNGAAYFYDNKIELWAPALDFELRGTHEWIKDVCRRFAKEGWYAIGGELYWRHGKPAEYTDIGKLVSELVAKIPDSEVTTDLDNEVAFAAKEGADVKRLAVTGFCWGGRQTWLYAAHNPKLKAAVAWYGPLVGTLSALKPRNPVDIAYELKVPVLGLYGAQDKGITAEHIARMRQALKDARNTSSRIDVFPDTGHGFFADYRDSYNEADAKQAWQRALAWLHEQGAG